MAETEVEKKEKEEEKKRSVINAGLAGAQTEVVQRFGSAVGEHVVAYKGYDPETGQKYAKGLKDIANSKVNPDDAS